MTTRETRKSRLRLLLIAAAALGSSSATLSGAITALSLQHPQAIAGDGAA